MRGVLVDQDEAVLGFGDDIGLGDLAAGDAEGEAAGFGRRRGRRLRTSERGWREEGGPAIVELP